VKRGEQHKVKELTGTDIEIWEGGEKGRVAEVIEHKHSPLYGGKISGWPIFCSRIASSVPKV
jgi:hypothetical protein